MTGPSGAFGRGAAMTAAAISTCLMIPPAAAQQPAAPDSSDVDRYVRALQQRVGSGPEEIRERLGAPDSVRVEARENRYDENHDDAVVGFHFPGITAWIVYAPASGRELLTDVVISSAERTRALPVGIGDPVDAVRDALGEPTEVEDGDLRYWFGTATNVLEFEVEGDTVTGIRLDYYTG